MDEGQLIVLVQQYEESEILITATNNGGKLFGEKLIN